MELLRDLFRYLFADLGWRHARFAAPVLGTIAVLGLLQVYALARRPADAARIDAVVVGSTVPAMIALNPSPTVPQSTTAVRTTEAVPTPVVRTTLVRSIQTALARQGCYDGPANGYWSRRTQEAMGQFVAVVDARLPVKQPEQALLALVETNPNARCDGPNVQAARPAPAAGTGGPVPAAGSTTQTAAASRAEASSASSAAASERPFGLPLDTGSIAATGVAAGVAAAAAARSDRVQPGLNASRSSEPKIEPKIEPKADTHSDRAEPTARPTREASSEPRRRRRRSANAFDGVSRQMTRSFKSLQRSLGSLF